MKVCYNLQSENPHKHELMPSNYPWTEYIVEDDFLCPDGFIELPLADYEALKASFDLTAFNEATAPVVEITIDEKIVELESRILELENKLNTLGA